MRANRRREAALDLALVSWRQTGVRRAIKRAASDDRLLIRIEAETLANCARSALSDPLAGRAGGTIAPAPPPTQARPRSPGPAGSAASASLMLEPVAVTVTGDPLKRLELALELRASISRSLLGVVRLIPLDEALPLIQSAEASITAHLRWLQRAASRERALVNEAVLSLRGLFANLRDGLIFMNTDGIVVDANRSVVEVTGMPREALVGRPFAEVWPDLARPELLALFERVLTSGAAETAYGVHFRAAPSDEVVFDLVVAPRTIGSRLVGTVSIVHYRTERTRLEEELRRAETLASVGRFASGIAHELRNLMAGVRAVAEMGLVEAERAGSAQVTSFGRILTVADRAAEVAEGLLALGRRTRPRLEELDLQALFDEVIDLGLDRDARERIAVRADASETPIVVADRGRLLQALLNLVRNAVQALGTGPGAIELTTRLVPGDPPHLEILVGDTGPGVPIAARERIFDPFVTTRQGAFGEAVGTGLGLPLVRAVAELHGGAVRLEPRDERGARFVLELPVRQAEAGPSRPRIASAPSGQELVMGPNPPRILIVDDDPTLREILSEILTRAGAEVVTSETFDKGLALLGEPHDRGAPFDMMFLDLVVPGLTGDEALARLRARHPELGVAILTGQSLTEAALDRLLIHCDVFLEKPFQVGEIVAAAQQILA